MNRPLVSILIPAYNAEHWIADTVRSALAQTYPNCEIIIIDDGSRDGTLAVARQFADEFPQKIRITPQKNAGAAAARNHALRLARGELIQYLDADDLLAPDKIALQIQALSHCPALTLAMGMWGRFTDKPEYTKWAKNEAVYNAQTGIEFLQLKLETHSMIQPGAWLVPRVLCEQAGPWDESPSPNDDGEFFARVVLRARRLVYVPASRVHYRSGIPSSLSRQRTVRALSALYRSEKLTIAHLLGADNSPRSRAAAVLGWRRLSCELYPEVPELAQAAQQAARELGAEDVTPIGAPNWVGQVARLLGWRNARRLQFLRNRFA